MKFGQLIVSNIWNIFLQKIYAENKAGRLVSDLLFFRKTFN